MVENDPDIIEFIHYRGLGNLIPTNELIFKLFNFIPEYR